MTEPQIITKLREELGKPVISEHQVVYILVQIRKLIDYQQDKEPLRALKLYCNWVVHTHLDQGGAEQLLDDLNARHSGLHPGERAQENFVRFWAELSLDRFRSELRSFLDSHNLPVDISADDGQWSEFLRHYFSTIQDCPLTYSYVKQTQLPRAKKWGAAKKRFDRVVLTKVEAEVGQGKTGPALKVRWDLYSGERLVAHWDADLGRGMLIGKILAEK